MDNNTKTNPRLALKTETWAVFKHLNIRDLDSWKITQLNTQNTLATTWQHPRIFFGSFALACIIKINRSIQKWENIDNLRIYIFLLTKAVSLRSKTVKSVIMWNIIIIILLEKYYYKLWDDWAVMMSTHQMNQHTKRPNFTVCLIATHNHSC